VGWWPTSSTGSRLSGQRAAARASCGWPGRQPVDDAQLAAQGFGRLAGAQRRADQHLGGLGQKAVQPLGHALGLLVAARRERARQVGRSVERRIFRQVTRLGMAPQDQFHRRAFVAGQAAGAM
jgi:hypothetical protein